MSLGRVYLAGPIAGLSYGDATDWRSQAEEWLKRHDIVGFSPMRWKRYLAREIDLKASGYDEFPLSSARGITTRDRFDTMRVDAMIVNVLGAEKVSIGTCIELGWADAARVPIILAIEKEGRSSVDRDRRGWVAALVDGEGNIHIQRTTMRSGNPNYQLRLGVDMKCREVIEELRRVVGKGAVRPTKRGLWTFRIVGQQAAEVLQDIYPWLIEKKARAGVAWEMAELVRGTQRQNAPNEGEQGFQKKSPEHYAKAAEIFGRFRRTYEVFEVEHSVPPRVGNPHDHEMVNEVVGFRVDRLEHGLEIARAILTPGG